MLRDTSAAPDLLGLERRYLFGTSCRLGCVGVVEHRAVDGAGDVVFGKFGGDRTSMIVS